MDELIFTKGKSVVLLRGYANQIRAVRARRQNIHIFNVFYLLTVLYR